MNTEISPIVKKVWTENGYDFYTIIFPDSDYEFCNIVPENSPAPGGGYSGFEYIADIKRVKIPEHLKSKQ